LSVGNHSNSTSIQQLAVAEYVFAFETGMALISDQGLIKVIDSAVTK